MFSEVVQLVGKSSTVMSLGNSCWPSNQGQISDACTFECLTLSWEHRGGGQWELYLHNSSEWVTVIHGGKDKALSLKRDKKYKLPRGGSLIQGLAPECVMSLCSKLDG